MIANVATAITTKFNSTPDGDALRSALTGGLFFMEAKWTDDVPVYPYAVFTWNGTNIDEIAGDRTNGVEIAAMTFSLYSNKDDGAVEIFSLEQLFIELYDWTELTYPAGEYTHLVMQRTSETNHGKIDNIRTIDLDYDVWYQH